MNLLKNGTSTAIKFALLTIVLLVSVAANADELNLYITTTRFMDDAGNTIFDIVYKIPYNQLEFVQVEDRFEANIRIAAVIEQGEKRVLWKQFDNPVVTFDRQKMASSGEYYMDKISLTLSKEMLIELNFIDSTSNKTAQYRKDLKLLQAGTNLSDIEFSTQVMVDTEHRFVKFCRGDSLYFVSPDRIFNLQNYSAMYLYYEIMNLQPSDQGISNYEETVTVFKGELNYRQTTNNEYVEGTKKNVTRRIDLSSYKSGKYEIEVKIWDMISGRETSRRESFIVRASDKTKYRFFTDIEDEFLLIKTFLPVTEAKVWDTLSPSAKDQYIDTFWRVNDPDPDTDENEFFKLVQERVSFANEHYSRFDDGWKSDRGRIYIRNGSPAERYTDFTDPSQTRFASKEYLIWKFDQPEHRVYLFIDNMNNGDFRLVYVDNDDKEQTLPSWQKYFGNDFDESLLQ